MSLSVGGCFGVQVEIKSEWVGRSVCSRDARTKRADRDCNGPLYFAADDLERS